MREPLERYAEPRMHHMVHGCKNMLIFFKYVSFKTLGVESRRGWPGVGGSSAGDLFAALANTPATAKDKTDMKPFKKRSMLWEIDHVSHSVLDPFGKRDSRCFALPIDLEILTMCTTFFSKNK